MNAAERKARRSPTGIPGLAHALPAPEPLVRRPVLDILVGLVDRRLILATDDGYQTDVRAVTDVTIDEDGDEVIAVVPESAWYLYRRYGDTDGSLVSQVVPFPAGLAWTDS